MLLRGLESNFGHFELSEVLYFPVVFLAYASTFVLHKKELFNNLRDYVRGRLLVDQFRNTAVSRSVIRVDRGFFAFGFDV